MCRECFSTSGLIMMPRVAFNFDSLMMALFVNVQLLGRSRCIPSHFSRHKFQTFSEEHALSTPLDDLHFRDRFSPLHPPPPTLKYPRGPRRTPFGISCVHLRSLQSSSVGATFSPDAI